MKNTKLNCLKSIIAFLGVFVVFAFFVPLMNVNEIKAAEDHQTTHFFNVDGYCGNNNKLSVGQYDLQSHGIEGTVNGCKTDYDWIHITPTDSQGNRYFKITVDSARGITDKGTSRSGCVDLLANGTTVYRHWIIQTLPYLNVDNALYDSYNNPIYDYEELPVDEYVDLYAKAEGEGLEYRWYCKRPSDSDWELACYGDNYYKQITSDLIGQEIYCKVTNEYGNVKETDRIFIKANIKKTFNVEGGEFSVGNNKVRYCRTNGVGWLEVTQTDTTGSRYYKVKVNKSNELKNKPTERVGYVDLLDANQNKICTYVIHQDNPYLKFSKTKVTLEAHQDSSEKIYVEYNCPYEIKFNGNIEPSIEIPQSQAEGGVYKDYAQTGKAEIDVQTKFNNNNGEPIVNSFNLCARGTNDRSQYLTVEQQQPFSIYTVLFDTNNHKIDKETKIPLNEWVHFIVDAKGAELTYEWRVTNPNKAEETDGNNTGNKYSCQITQEKSGQKVYCIVRDKYGNEAKTDTITITAYELKVNNDGGCDTFLFCADGSLDDFHEYASPLAIVKKDGKNYLKLEFNSGTNWVISTDADYVHFVDENLKTKTNGSSGDNSVLVYLDSFPLSSFDDERTCEIKIIAGNSYKSYKLIQNNYFINGYIKSEYRLINELVKHVETCISPLYVSECQEAIKHINCEVITNEEIKVFQLNAEEYLAISTKQTGPDSIKLEYLKFEARADIKDKRLFTDISFVESYGMKFMAVDDENYPLVSSNVRLNYDKISLTDENYLKQIEDSKWMFDLMEDGAAILSYKLPDPGEALFDSVIAQKIASMTFKVSGSLIDNNPIDIIQNMYIKAAFEDNGENGVRGRKGGKYFFNPYDNCTFTKNNDRIKVEGPLENQDCVDVIMSIKIVNSSGDEYIYVHSILYEEDKASLSLSTNKYLANPTTTGVKITKQPSNASASIGKAVKTTVTAEGDGLTYQWYVKNPGATSFVKSSITTNVYEYVMTEEKNGRQVYCIITDKDGNKIQSNTVTLGTPVKITKQPTNASASIGKAVKTTVTATGNGLKYQWYVKNPGATSFVKSSITTNVYEYVMTEEKSGRQVYCIITDTYGNKVQSNTVTLGTPVRITKQPTNASAAIGKAVKTSVTAEGYGLKYQWYVKNPGATSFVKSSITTNVYEYVMTEEKSGRQVYCVITDKFGNSVETATVILKKQ